MQTKLALIVIIGLLTIPAIARADSLSLGQIAHELKQDAVIPLRVSTHRLFGEAPQNGARLPPQSVIACSRAFLNRTAGTKCREPAGQESVGCSSCRTVHAVRTGLASAEHRCGATLRLSRQGIARSSHNFSRTSKW